MESIDISGSAEKGGYSGRTSVLYRIYEVIPPGCGACLERMGKGMIGFGSLSTPRYPKDDIGGRVCFYHYSQVRPGIQTNNFDLGAHTGKIQNLT